MEPEPVGHPAKSKYEIKSDEPSLIEYLLRWCNHTTDYITASSSFLFLYYFCTTYCIVNNQILSHSCMTVLPSSLYGFFQKNSKRFQFFFLFQKESKLSMVLLQFARFHALCNFQKHKQWIIIILSGESTTLIKYLTYKSSFERNRHFIDSSSYFLF